MSIKLQKRDNNSNKVTGISLQLDMGHKTHARTWVNFPACVRVTGRVLSNIARLQEKLFYAPYLGAFQSLNATSCRNLSAGIARFPPR